MSRTPQYIHKHREYRGKVARAFGGYADTYGPWKTIGRYPTHMEAIHAARADAIVGMWVHAIFHKGKRLP